MAVYEYDTIIQARQNGNNVIIYPVTQWGNILDAPEVGDLNLLETEDKSSIVNAINEVFNGTVAGSTYVTTRYIDVLYAETEDQTEFTLDFPNWSADDDFDMLTVVSGRLPLTPIEDYSVNGNVLTLVEGVEAGRNLSLYLLRNEVAVEPLPYRLDRFRQDMVAVSENQTTFTITVSDFDSSTDMVELISGRTWLTEDLDFTIAGNTLTLVEGVPAGRRLALYVMRNVEVAPITAYRNFMIEASDGKRYMIDIDAETGMTYTEIITD